MNIRSLSVVSRQSEGMVMFSAMDVQRRRSMNIRSLSVVPMVDGHGEVIHHESTHRRYHGHEGREGEFMPWITRQVSGLQVLNSVWKYVHEASCKNNPEAKALISITNNKDDDNLEIHGIDFIIAGSLEV